MPEPAYRTSTAKVERRPSQAERLKAPRRSRWPRALKLTGFILGGLLLLVALALVSLNFFEGHIRGYMEQQLNNRIEGYRFAIGGLDIQPFALSVDIENLRMMEAAHPEPPMAQIPLWHASLQWSEVLKGHVVSDHRVDRPVFHLTRLQAKQETKEAIEATKDARGKKRWQELVTTLYPVTIHEFKVDGASVTYVDSPSATPLQLAHVDIRINNVRNVQGKSNEFPSPVHIEARFGKGGSLMIDGAADLLAAPLPAVHADLRVGALDLAQLRPIAARYNVIVEAGLLSASGHVELSSGLRLAKLLELMLDGVRADYVYTAREKPAKAAEPVLQDVETGPVETVAKIVEAKIRKSDFGLVNKTVQPEYRVYLTDVDAELKNLSTRLKDGTGYITLTGKFMGSGDVRLAGTFRPETNSPDFDLNLKIENTRLSAMNNVLRAHGKFDVTKGRFSLYTELSVRDGRVQGYIKPLFQDMDVYDSRQDKGKPVLKQLYEGVVGGVSNLLQNDNTDAVATKAEVSGQLDNPKAGTWEALVTLIRNAFIRAVLPGFDRGRGG